MNLFVRREVEGKKRGGRKVLQVLWEAVREERLGPCWEISLGRSWSAVRDREAGGTPGGVIVGITLDTSGKHRTGVVVQSARYK